MAAPLTLDQIREKALGHTVTPDEKRAQRLSLITGVLSHRTTLSREKVETLLNQIEGHPSGVGAKK